MASSIGILNTLSIPQREVFLRYARSCADRYSVEIGSLRGNLVYRDRVYQRQIDATAESRATVRESMKGKPRVLRDVTLPIVMPQIESAVAYQAGVFLTSYPIFGVVALPEMQTAALQFETALGDQSVRYGWARELIKAFRDGFKYNFAPTVVDWEITPLRSVITSTDTSTAGMAKIQQAAYGGNCIKRVDPYNCFFDMSVAPAELHQHGEFFGYNTLVSRVRLKQFISTLDTRKTTQVREAYEAGTGSWGQDATDTKAYYVPTINQYMRMGVDALNNNTGWASWLPEDQQKKQRFNYRDHYVLTTFYCRAVPADFGATGNNVKLYKAYIVNWKHVIYVEEIAAGHDFLPALIMQPYEDGLGFQTQSMLDNAVPYQEMGSALWNMSLESKRRAIFDRLVYNPRLIDKKDIDAASSVSRIPLRNASLAKDDNAISRAIYQIPYRDENIASNLQMAEMISAMADQATGQNKVDRGQFQPGNKTKTEFQTVMGNSNSRQQLVALSLEYQFMGPLKEIIKANTLQYQPAAKLLNRDQKALVQVDPVELRQAILEFKMTDGMLPADKLLNSEMLTVFMQTAQAIPGFVAEYDVMGMFLYWAKLRGAYWIEDFKRSPEQQAQFMQTVQGFAAAQSTGDAAGQAQLQAQQPQTA